MIWMCFIQYKTYHRIIMYWVYIMYVGVCFNGAIKSPFNLANWNVKAIRIAIISHNTPRSGSTMSGLSSTGYKNAYFIEQDKYQQITLYITLSNVHFLCTYVFYVSL